VDGHFTTPLNAYSKLTRAKQGCHAYRAGSVGTFGS